MIVNRSTLLTIAPIKNMLETKQTHGGVTHGLSEAGYDIRIKQSVRFAPQKPDYVQCFHWVIEPEEHVPVLPVSIGRFALASTIEEFNMPPNLVGIVHDKSTWARRGLSVLNTVIEPGWKGKLTLELVYHGNTELVIPAGAGITQVIFHEVTEAAQYTGKYQGQPDEPVPARFE